MAAERFDLKNLAGTLAEIVEKSFQGAFPVNFSDKPAIEVRDIIEYDGRMRVSGMEIFNGPTYISAVNFYRSAKEQAEGKACGAIVIYLKEGQLEALLKGAGFKGVDDEDGQSVMNACAELSKTIAVNFKNELKGKGYSELILSSAKSYQNNVPSGIDFSFDQYQKYEISFSIKGEKSLAADLTLSPIS